MSIKLPSGIEIVPIEELWSSVWETQTCKLIGDTVAHVYPGYQWVVRAHAAAGYFIIQCADINAELASNLPYGMLMHVSKMADHGILRKKIIRMAGELLERANLVRGKATGDTVKRLEGIPEAQQPVRQYKIVLAA